MLVIALSLSPALSRKFSKESHKYLRRCLILLAMSKIHINTILRLHLRMVQSECQVAKKQTKAMGREKREPYLLLLRA